MSHTNFLLLSLSVLLLNACSSSDEGTPPAELTDYKQSIELQKNWGNSLGGGENLFYKIEPIIVNDDIYTISAEGRVSKVNLNSGNVIWQKDLSQQIYAGLAASNEVIVVANRDGFLSVYENNENLPLIWQKQILSEVNVQPVINANDLFVRLSNGQLNSYNLMTGEKQWSVSHRVPKLSLTGSSKPSVFSDLVYSGFDNGRLVAYDRNSGETAWRKTISVPTGRSELDRMVDIDGAFYIENNVIYVSAFQGRLSAIQTQDGSELWSRPMSSVNKISADSTVLYVSDQDSVLWAIDRRSGAALWKQDALHDRNVSAMTIVDDHVVVADFEGYAHWLNKQTGRLAARMSISGEKISNPPLLNKQQILFLDSANELVSVSVVK